MFFVSLFLLSRCPLLSLFFWQHNSGTLRYCKITHMHSLSRLFSILWNRGLVITALSFTSDTWCALISWVSFKKAKTQHNFSTTAVSSEEVRNISKWSKAGSRLSYAKAEEWIFHIYDTHKSLNLNTVQSVTYTVTHSVFLSVKRTPKVNIVLPLSSAWQDKADKRWSCVSTSHDRRNRVR